MANGAGVVLKEACAKQDIHTIHRIISEMNTVERLNIGMILPTVF